MHNLRKQFPDVPILTLSASMRDVDISNAIGLLGITGCVIIKERDDRTNICYSFKMKDELPKNNNVAADIVEFIKK